MSADLDIIDFHSHYIHPSWTITTALSGDQANRDRWAKINRDLADREALVADIDSGDIAGRVVNSPTAFIEKEDGRFPDDAPSRLNDQLAELVATRPHQLFALATVDTFGGDAAARELHRAVTDLGFKGVFLASGRGDLLVNAPQARPVLAAAAELEVPVFLHPINPQPLTNQLEPLGRIGTLLARGTVNSAALAALITDGVFDELPKLKVVVTNLAIAGILLAAAYDKHPEGRSDAATVLRRQVYADTMGFNPVVIRSLVDTLGADHVLAGSDWPIVSTGPIAARLATTLEAANIGRADRQSIAGANIRRLMRL
ncbi:MAG: amidohydrolase family protein [Mesorhizobium sp.]